MAPNPTLIVLIVIGLPVICGTLITLTLIILHAMKKQRSGSPSSDETRILQELHQSLLRLEKRIDALETIYFETDRHQKGHSQNENLR
ncbi:MAG: Phage shock protein B [Verrucomicrobia bacterium ADurb.Bin474]|nr:MAG: Phage shock protein B [Verrucomicrobia bacterium ADurb.Bin474]